ncbi:response regulator transcription factor [Streptomyces canus]|uniref:response regulator transcription factor n=1 Tax=Streptomyces canus TaxID=58343 RepID=UPI002253EED4|nr:response regulator transcription factor [Streptomyces canus]MCX4854916.1 response regulator transcription factor [Streptomyces canus]WSW39681.1 response regulator transcription factor [Streptomyces canus]
MNIRVLVCCEDAILGSGMRALLDQQPDITVVGNTTGADSAAAAAAQEPDVLVIVSPALTVEHKRELAALSAGTKVVLIAKSENAPRSIEALRVGVQAVLTPDTSAEELVHVLRTVSAGGAIVMPKEARPSLHHLPDDTSSASTASLSAPLTPRESEVMVLLAQGKSNAEIAEKMSVSTATVRSHVHHLLRKLGVGTRAQAVAVAYESGLISAIGRNSVVPDQGD